MQISLWHSLICITVDSAREEFVVCNELYKSLQPKKARSAQLYGC